MAGIPAPVAAHPNASTATGLGGLGLIAVWLLGRFGVKLGAEEATLISAGVTSLGLLVGKNGVAGLFRLVWRGTSP